MASRLSTLKLKSSRRLSSCELSSHTAQDKASKKSVGFDLKELFVDYVDLTELEDNTASIDSTTKEINVEEEIDNYNDYSLLEISLKELSALH